MGRAKILCHFKHIMEKERGEKSQGSIQGHGRFDLDCEEEIRQYSLLNLVEQSFLASLLEELGKRI